MKNLFTLNTTTGQSSTDEFIIRKISAETSARQNERLERLHSAERYANSPVWLTIIMYAAFAFALIFSTSFVNALIELGANKALYNARILLPVAVTCFVLALAILIFKKIRYNKTVSSASFRSLGEEVKKANETGYRELAVPEAADGITAFLSIVNVNRKGQEKNLAGVKYFAFEYKIFVENDCLCLADAESVAAMPLSMITAIYTVNKRATFANWNKEEKPRSPKYKPYKIKHLNNGFYGVKPYYSLRFTHSGEEYEIAFPPYELETVRKYVRAPLI
ncbi:MAG: hypothetical protein NC489_27490 [Ruminococcus flavefaciens]|nr:hypothetical protein [Ruminococcus flavefaciens]